MLELFKELFKLNHGLRPTEVTSDFLEMDLLVGQKLRRAFEAYVRFAKECGTADGDFMSSGVSLLPIGTKSALDCFRDAENGLEPLSCRDPEELRCALLGKKLLNFHITDLWGPAIRELMEWMPFLAWTHLFELMDDLPYLPQSVWKTLWNKTVKGQNDRCMWPWEVIIEKRAEYTLMKARRVAVASNESQTPDARDAWRTHVLHVESGM